MPWYKNPEKEVQIRRPPKGGLLVSGISGSKNSHMEVIMAELKTYVAYYRVSTVKQGRSGLGLEAQRSAVEGYLAAQGGEVVAEYVEVESGRRKDREQLKLAMNHARIARASLIIAKLDRLARNVSFTAALMESGIDFICCDMPHANKFTIHVMAALAEMEGEMISVRTKAALAEAKRRGVRLGNPRLAEVRGSPEAASRARAAQAAQRASAYRGLIFEAQQEGRNTLQAVADFLNSRGVRSPSGHGVWHPSAVSRLLRRLQFVT